MRVAQQLIGPRGKSERGAASAFPDIESLVMEEGECQYQSMIIECHYKTLSQASSALGRVMVQPIHIDIAHQVLTLPGTWY